MKLRINYWRTQSGKSPVGEYIDDIDNIEERAEILSLLKGVQENGTGAVGVEFRQIEGKLWELKIRLRNHQHRIFYVVLKGNEMVLLHAYLKKTQKAPSNDIQVAKHRMKQLREGYYEKRS